MAKCLFSWHQTPSLTLFMLHANNKCQLFMHPDRPAKCMQPADGIELKLILDLVCNPSKLNTKTAFKLKEAAE